MKPSTNRPTAWRIAIALLLFAFVGKASAEPDPQPPPAKTPSCDFSVGKASTPVNLGVDLSVYLTGDQKVKELVECAGSLSNVVLYLNGYPMAGIPARYGPGESELIFRLERTDNSETQKAWAALLGGLKESEKTPDGKDEYGRNVSVSLGYGGTPLKTTAWTRLLPLRMTATVGFIIVLLVLLAALVILAWRSNLVRDIGLVITQTKVTKTWCEGDQTTGREGRPGRTIGPPGQISSG